MGVTTEGLRFPGPSLLYPDTLTWLSSALPLGPRCGSWDLGGASLEQDLGLVRSLSTHLWPTSTHHRETSGGHSWAVDGKGRTPSGVKVQSGALNPWASTLKIHGVHWSPAQELRMTQVPSRPRAKVTRGLLAPQAPEYRKPEMLRVQFHRHQERRSQQTGAKSQRWGVP